MAEYYGGFDEWRQQRQAEHAAMIAQARATWVGRRVWCGSQLHQGYGVVRSINDIGVAMIAFERGVPAPPVPFAGVRIEQLGVVVTLAE